MSDAAFSGYAAIVLAGGQSRRMGADKAGVLLGGIPLLDRVLARLARVFAEVVVVGRRGKGVRPPDVEGSDPFSGVVRFVADERPGLGPLGGLNTGLGGIHSDRAFVVGCDMPFIDEVFLRALASHDGNADATVARVDGQPQPLLAIYDRRIRPVAERLLHSDDRSLRALLRSIHVCYVDLDGAARAAFSVNTPAALAEAERRLQEDV